MHYFHTSTMQGTKQIWPQSTPQFVTVRCFNKQIRLILSYPYHPVGCWIKLVGTNGQKSTKAQYSGQSAFRDILPWPRRIQRPVVVQLKREFSPIFKRSVQDMRKIFTSLQSTADWVKRGHNYILASSLTSVYCMPHLNGHLLYCSKSWLATNNKVSLNSS